MPTVKGLAAASLGAAVTFTAAAALAQGDRTVVVAPPQSPTVVQPQATAPGAAAPAPRESVAEEESVPNKGAIISGAVMFGLPYASSIIVAGESSHPGDAHLYVPVVGPWLDLGDRGGCPATGSCDTETTNKVLLVADGVLQGLGVLQILGGFVFPEKRVVSRSSAATKPTLRVAPARFGLGAYGLSAVGTF
jgi:hypothetical protein